MKIYRSPDTMGNDYCMTTYAEQRALGDIAIGEVATALGATRVEGRDYYGNHYNVELADGVGLYLTIDAKAGKLRASGDYHKAGEVGYFRKKHDDEAGMSLLKGPARIAAEIRRRVLPGVIANLKDKADAFAAETAAARLRDTNADRVAKVIGWRPAGHRFNQALNKTDTSFVRVPTEFDAYGEFQFYPGSDTCKIELSSVPIGTAVAIAELLKARAPKKVAA